MSRSGDSGWPGSALGKRSFHAARASSPCVHGWLLGSLLLATALGLGLSSTLRARSETQPTALSALPEVKLELMETEIRSQIEALNQAITTLHSQSSRSQDLSEAYGTLGRLYQIYGMNAAAEVALRNAGIVAPEEWRWRYSLALLYQQQGEHQSAVQELQEVLALRPKDLASRLRLGDAYLALGRPSLASQIFAETLEVDPQSAAAHYGAGKAAAATSDPARAAEHFKRTLSLQPEATIVHYPLAQAYRRLGQRELAREHLEKRGLQEVIFSDPLAQELDHLTALAALQLVKALAAKTKGFSEADFLGYVLSLLARVEGVIQELEKHLSNWPEARRQQDATQRARLHYAAGGLLVHRSLEARAEAHFRTAVELDPALQDARIKLANVLARGGSYREAVDELSRLLEEDPDHPGGRLKRAAALMSQGRLDEATQDLRWLVDREPHNPEVRFRLGVALERSGRAELAIEQFIEAAKESLSPGQAASAHSRAARLLLAKSSFEEARLQYETAVALAPDQIETRLDLANLLGHLGELEQALDHFRRLTTREPGLEAAQKGAAVSLILRARWSEARACLETGLRQIPGSNGLQSMQARLLAMAPEDAVRDGGRALELARALYQIEPSLSNAQTLAAAQAENGDFAAAIDLLQGAADQISGAPRQHLRAELERWIARFKAGLAWRASTPHEILTPLADPAANGR